jgi:tRNA G18 (ribose-2'-O)-methylase SpoU
VFTLRPITSLEAPELEPYRTMRRSVEHEEKQIFVAEWVKVVRRLLESRFTVVSVLLPEKWLAPFTPLLEARPENFPLFVASEKALLEQLTGFSMFQGVLAVGRIPALRSLETVVAESPRPRLFAAVDALTNSENLGALVRNCAAFNVQCLLVGETCSSPFLRRAVRNSMGTIFDLPVVQSTNLALSLHQLKEHQVRSIAAHPHASGKSLSQADFTSDCCLVFGSEGYGLSPAVLDACEDAAAIPMPPNVDSLNVGSAAAVFLYEANRQRGTWSVQRRA